MKDGYFSSDRNKNFCMTTCTLSNVKIQKKKKIGGKYLQKIQIDKFPKTDFKMLLNM